ncbi:hypothetical protein BVC80_41g20 [Macleaya cordata]|uniref:Uncharacterized protein n=1 Tax=Macleaya cordata TaxID=56857 RepID=A0A200QMN5_MACCD|nr:hypothetical protein BVC80_41g20 [Macleaya cordata]
MVAADDMCILHTPIGVSCDDCQAYCEAGGIYSDVYTCLKKGGESVCGCCSYSVGHKAAIV